MTASEHLQIINPSYSACEVKLFRLFPLLSTELRLRVWNCSIKQHRLLEIEVDRPYESKDTTPYSTTNALDKLISGRNYTATVQGCHLYSKLLHVNSESRQAAHKFYRIHIPCYFRTSKDQITKSILYCNPEYDFIFLRAEHPPEHTFVDFVHDLKAYDPKNVGLLNLALDINGMSALHSLTSISEAPANVNFVETLRRLKEIIWVAKSISGRGIFGPLDNFQGAGVRFNHSMPVKAITPTFNIRQDPRAVELDLRYVLTASTDPRQMRVEWRQLLERWDIKQAKNAKERVLFACEVPQSEEQICNIETAHSFLKHEEERWLRVQHKWHWLVMKHAGKLPVENQEELLQAVKPAIGFWLFPAEALGALEGELSQSKKVFDMTSHWPELALSSLISLEYTKNSS